MITHFAVGMPVETFKSKKKSVYLFEVYNFEDKRSLVDIDQLPNMSFQFFYRVDPVFSFSFVKSIKIGSFPRFGYPKIRRGRDACSEEVLYHIAAQQVPGFGD